MGVRNISMHGSYRLRAFNCRLLLILLLLSFSCATAPRGEKAAEADAHYKVAVSHMQEGNYQSAYVELQKSIVLDPDNKHAYYALGLIHQYFEEIEKAEESLRKAITLDPDYAEAYNALGIVYTRTQRWNEAAEAFIKALEHPLYLNPEKAFTNLGKVYYRMAQHEKAMAAYKHAIRRAPDFYPAYYGLALCYNALRRYGDASEALNEAIRLDPRTIGSVEKAREELTIQKLKTSDRLEEEDLSHLIEVLHY